MRSLSTCQDHKPDSPGERERLEAAGSEVRQVGAQACIRMPNSSKDEG